jgi:hypothetical protein
VLAKEGNIEFLESTDMSQYHLFKDEYQEMVRVLKKFYEAFSLPENDQKTTYIESREKELEVAMDKMETRFEEIKITLKGIMGWK